MSDDRGTDPFFERRIADEMHTYLDAVRGPDARWSGSVELGRRAHRSRPHWGRSLRIAAGIAAALAIFAVGLSFGVRLGSNLGPASSGNPSAAVVGSGGSSPSHAASATIGSAEPSTAPSAVPSPPALASASAVAVSPSGSPEPAALTRPRLLTWFGQSIVVQSTASGQNQVELWTTTGTGQGLMGLPDAGDAATAHAASDGTTLLVDTCGPTVTIFDKALKPKQVVVGTATQAGSCRSNSQPFAQISDGGYFSSSPGSITVIGKDGKVATKPVPAKWTVIGAVHDGDGLLVRDINSDPADCSVYELDRLTGVTNLILDHVNGYQPEPQQSIDVATFGALRRIDWSWWNVSYQLPYMVAIEGVADVSMSHITRSFFDPVGWVLAEVSASNGNLLVGDARGVRGMSASVKAGSIPGPIYDVIVTEGTMAVSAKSGIYLATMNAVTKLAIPKVAPAP